MDRGAYAHGAAQAVLLDQSLPFRFDGLRRSPAETRAIALDRTGVHAFSAAAAAGLVDEGNELVVWTGLSMPNFLCACRASQQQPQQLQMKLDHCAGRFRRIGPDPVHRPCSSRPMHSDASHRPRVAVFDQRGGRRVEGHADIHGSIAGSTQVLHLVAAIAQADPDYARPVRMNGAGPLVIKDMQGVLVRQRRSWTKDPAQLGFAIGEERLDEVLFHVQVLVKTARQEPSGRYPFAGASLKIRKSPPSAEAGSNTDPPSFSNVDQDGRGRPSSSQKPFVASRLFHFPDPGGPSPRRRVLSQERNEFGFLLLETGA